MTIRPLAGKILVEAEGETVSKGGIILLPEDRKISKGKVVAIGADPVDKKGKSHKITALLGDTLYFKPFTATKWQEDYVVRYFVAWDNVIGLLRADKLIAVRDTTIVKVIYAETIGLIVLPDSTKAYSGNFCGEVISVGPEYRNDIWPGVKIHFTRHEGHKIDFKGEKYLSLRSKWVLGKERTAK